MSALLCDETLPEVPLKSAALQPSPATLLQRTIQRRLSQAQLTPGRRARRRLFAAVDPDEVSRFVKKELATIRATDRRRYNFDFDKMQPLSGRFQWEKIGGSPGACENSPLHRSARRLQLDCPPAADADHRNEQESAGDMKRMKSASPAHTTSPWKFRVCFPPAADASNKTPKEASPLRCGQNQDSCHRSSTSSERLANTRLRQTALTDLWQTRKRASVWSACGDSQPQKRLLSGGAASPVSGLRSVLMTSAQGDHAEGPSGDGRPVVHSRQAVLGQLQGQGVAPS